MASDNLNLTEIAENQDAKELTANTAFNDLDNATQKTGTFTFTANAKTLSQAEFTRYQIFKLSNQSAAAALTVPLTNRVFHVWNANSTYNIVVGGATGTTVTVEPLKAMQILCDGTNCVTIVANTANAVLDAVLGSTQGMVAYRSATAWTGLATSNTGRVLTTGGAGANPAWEEIHQVGTFTATTTVVVDPTQIDTAVIDMGSANTTVTVSPGYPRQRLMLEIRQGATAYLVATDATIEFGTDITSYTATAVANKRDLVQLIANSTGSIWAFAAINHGLPL